MRRIALILAILPVLASMTSSSQEQSAAPMMYGQLTVNRTHIVFTLAGDLWMVGRQGGAATRITNGKGESGYPVFSPDGSMLAYAQQTGGQWEVHCMTFPGGEPKRLTWHPSRDYPVSWSPDGKSVYFLSIRTGNRKLYRVEIDGVLPRELPFWTVAASSASPDGERIAITAQSGLMTDWRYYRGGMQGRIRLTNLRDWSTEEITAGDQNEESPMWIGRSIYFLSDQSGIFNLYSFDPASKRRKQLTRFEKYGITDAGAGPDAVAFVRDGRIHLHDLKSGETRQVSIRVEPDRKELGKRTARAVQYNDWAALSGDGGKVSLGIRGDAFVFDPATGAASNLTRTPGAAERYPVLSPDGGSIAYFSDESGEYQLHIRSLTDEGGIRRIRIEEKPTFYREPVWSPDGRYLAFTDHRLGLWIADVERGTSSRIDSSTYSYQEEWFPRWSPDSRWLTYSKHLRNRVRTAFIYGIEAKKAVQVSDGVTHVEQPCFDAGGRYLYFLSSPNAGTSEFGWGVLSGMMARPLVSRTLHLMLLQADAPAPLMPDGSPNPAAAEVRRAEVVRIDFNGLNRRVIDLPVEPHDFTQIVPAGPGRLMIQINEWPDSPSPLRRTGSALYSYALSSPARLEKMLDRVGGFEVSTDGSRLLYGLGPYWHLVPANATPKASEGRVEIGKLTIDVDPQAEWQQIYAESWRIMRDWFYDANHHGLDLKELEKHYGEYLPGISRRADLNMLLNRMLGHVSVSHLGVGGGDVAPPDGPPVRIGLLGADYEIADGRYRIKKIYRSSAYNGVAGTVRSPLDYPGVDVREGDYLIAVNGSNAGVDRNVNTYFSGIGTSPVQITVAGSADGAGARTVTVYPVTGEAELRGVDEIEAARRRVEEASGGKLGYIYIGDFGQSIMHFIRLLAGYGDRQGVVIDQRFNGGGITSDYLIEWLNRKALYYYSFREGDNLAVPVNPGPQAKVLITNERNFSAAETFAFMFRLGNLGPIVGARTGGGGIGPYVFTPRLIDGGRIQLPNRAAYNPDGSSWGIENIGIKPDVEVDILPKDVISGRDPQIEKAIQLAMEALKKKAVRTPVKPAYPVHR